MKIELGYALEHTMGSFNMGLWIRGGNEEVFHVDDELSFSNHVLEGVIHELLKYSKGVAETKEHDCWLEEPFVCGEGHLPLMAIFDVNIIVTSSNIKLDKVTSIF